MKIRVKSFRESNWGQYSSDNCWDEYDILMNYDAVDFCEMCNSSEGSAIADQLCDILTGEEELKEQNPNALEYIKQFCERKGEMDLADAIAKYLEDEDQDGTLDKFMESKKNSNKSVKESYEEFTIYPDWVNRDTDEKACYWTSPKGRYQIEVHSTSDPSSWSVEVKNSDDGPWMSYRNGYYNKIISGYNNAMEYANSLCDSFKIF